MTVMMPNGLTKCHPTEQCLLTILFAFITKHINRPEIFTMGALFVFRASPSVSLNLSYDAQ